VPGRAWPIIGRADEAGFLVDAVVNGRGAVVAGPAGIGKTALAALAAQQLVDTGWTATTHTATPERGSVPFAPFAGLAIGTHDDQLGRMLGALAAVQQHERTVLVVDDVQWLDEVSATFLRLLLDSTDARLLLTVRTGEARPDVVDGLWRSGVLARVDLQPLTHLDVVRLLAARLPNGSTTALARSVSELTRGNPLYVRELLRGSMSSGGLQLERGVWTLVTPPVDALHELLGARLDEARSEQEQHALALLAVADDLGLATLQALVGADAVAALEQLGLVTLIESARRCEVRLAHPIYAERVRAKLGVTGARAARGEALAALERTGLRRAGDAIRAAIWRLELGDYSNPASLLDAARHLAGGFSRALLNGDVAGAAPVKEGMGTAKKLAVAALDAGAGFEAAELLVHLCSQSDDGDGAREAMQRMTSLASTDEERVRSALLRASEFILNDGDFPSATAMLTETEAELSDPTALRSLQALRTLVLMFMNEPAAAIEVGTAVLEDDRTLRADRLHAIWAIGVSMNAMGRSTDTLSTLDEEIGKLDFGPTTGADAGLLIIRLMALTDDGQLRAAADLAHMAMRLAESFGWDEGTALIAAVVANIDFVTGDLVMAAEHARAAAALSGQLDRFGQRRAALAVLASALAVMGDLDGAAAALVEMRVASQRMKILDLAEVRGEAAVAARNGEPTRARRLLRDAARSMVDQGRLTHAMAAMHDLVRIGDADIVDELVATGRACQGELAAARVAHGLAFASGDGAALDAVSERFEAMGSPLFAAEAAAQAASAHETQRLLARAKAARQRSHELARACGAGSLLVDEVPDLVVVLTVREREIAGLAAGGLSDKAIAERLAVSARTVQSHLYSTYGKLGITGRSELAAALAEV
jgi:DNA-binding CsgD family transcriptional regulator